MFLIRGNPLQLNPSFWILELCESSEPSLSKDILRSQTKSQPRHLFWTLTISGREHLFVNFTLHLCLSLYQFIASLDDNTPSMIVLVTSALEYSS